VAVVLLQQTPGLAAPGEGGPGCTGAAGAVALAGCHSQPLPTPPPCLNASCLPTSQPIVQPAQPPVLQPAPILQDSGAQQPAPIACNKGDILTVAVTMTGRGFVTGQAICADQVVPCTASALIFADDSCTNMGGVKQPGFLDCKATAGTIDGLVGPPKSYIVVCSAGGGAITIRG
jgi:hypothetical protein